MDPLSAPPPRPGQAKRKIPKAFIAITVIGLLVLGGAAAAYFFLLSNKSSATGPEAVIERCYRALAAGDLDAVKACFAPEAQSKMAEFEQFRTLFQNSTATIKELELKTLTESGNEAEVEVVSLIITYSIKGTTVTMNLKDMLQEKGVQRASMKLKKLDGKWLITLPEGP